MQDRVLVSPEECTSNSNGLLNEDVEIASEDIGGGDKRNREGTMEINTQALRMVNSFCSGVRGNCRGIQQGLFEIQNTPLEKQKKK